jgi:hypothetical protein
MNMALIIVVGTPELLHMEISCEIWWPCRSLFFQCPSCIRLTVGRQRSLSESKSRPYTSTKPCRFGALLGPLEIAHVGMAGRLAIFASSILKGGTLLNLVSLDLA